MKIYKCICGEEFTEPQKFNGHKQGCKEHLINKYGSLESYYAIKNRSIDRSVTTRKANTLQRKQQQLEQWISEQHTCEKCGKVMTEKFGSGRFCSAECSHSRTISQETKQKISQSVRNSLNVDAVKAQGLKHHNDSVTKYYQNPKLCKHCGKVIPYERKSMLSCSKPCQSAITGGPRYGCSYGKHGKYKGFECDSTYELVFIIYCLENNIEIVRNKESFPYTYDNNTYNYYPDFYLPQYDTYIEIKGRDIGPVYEKLQGATALGKKIKLLHYEDIIPCFEYVRKHYGITYSASNNNAYILYES